MTSSILLSRVFRGYGLVAANRLDEVRPRILGKTPDARSLGGLLQIAVERSQRRVVAGLPAQDRQHRMPKGYKHAPAAERRGRSRSPLDRPEGGM